jgi:hypothetical protein
MVDRGRDMATHQDYLVVAGGRVVAVNAGFAVELQVFNRRGKDID